VGERVPQILALNKADTVLANEVCMGQIGDGRGRGEAAREKETKVNERGGERSECRRSWR
jgi:hypothetical protein